jgi:hypothetical protein
MLFGGGWSPFPAHTWLPKHQIDQPSRPRVELSTHLTHNKQPFLFCGSLSTGHWHCSRVISMLSANNGVSGSAKKPRKSRGKGLRTNTGCTICRKRHTKCDEVKPICGPCAKGQRPCEYGTPATTIVQDHALPLQPSKPALPTTTGSPANTFTENRPGDHTRFSPIPPDQGVNRPWPGESIDDTVQITSPQSSLGSAYGTDVAPLRWFGLLAGDMPYDHNKSPLDTLGDAASSQRYIQHLQGAGANRFNGHRQSSATPSDTPSPSMPYINLRPPASAVSPPTSNHSSIADEHRQWRSLEPLALKGDEHAIFERFVNCIALWIDLFDPLKHFSTFVPHLALHNEGLMKALLALGARHMSIKGSDEVRVDRAVQYYDETLRYLQGAMRFTSYKNSQELHATVLVVSTYEMIDGTAKNWERHLKGVFWIQRSRDINGESGGISQAAWWAWLRQDIWASLREGRRLFSFFKPTRSYESMDMWDMASRVVYILAQAVNYSSKEETKAGETDLPSRILRATTLLGLLDEWRRNISIHFSPLPIQGPFESAFVPLWFNPPALGVSVQMYCCARILLLVNQPAAGGYLECQSRERTIAECVDTVGGVAMRLSDDATRLMSTQCLYAAGLYCTVPAKQNSIAELIRDHSAHTGWPTNTDLVEELRVHWAEQAK